MADEQQHQKSTLYSWTARINYIVYLTMILLSVTGMLNHVSVLYGHKIGIRKSAVGLAREDIVFEVREVDQFLSDRIFQSHQGTYAVMLDWCCVMQPAPAQSGEAMGERTPKEQALYKLAVDAMVRKRAWAI